MSIDLKLLAESKVKDKGFIVLSVEEKETRIKSIIHMECDKGHPKTITYGELSRCVCMFCTGKRVQVGDFEKRLDEEGYTYTRGDHIQEDIYGIAYVTPSKRVMLHCDKGHETSHVVRYFMEGETCKVCSKQASTVGFSRGEDIIAKVLDYNNIKYIRQYSITDEGNGLPVDFYIEDLNLVIEYDGKQHKLGRSDDDTKTPEYMKERDEARDELVRSKGIDMLRIDGEYIIGKRIIFHLKENIDELRHINPYDGVYDDMVRETTDLCHKLYGWNSYDKIKKKADIWKVSTVSDIKDKYGTSPSKYTKSFMYIYGIPKSRLVK
ncbi:homing endonuclease [Bacillus phage vB_BceH_LY2]|nr:homing endonuclease [Bacillus phage vB_BceH_LY2]